MCSEACARGLRVAQAQAKSGVIDSRSANSSPAERMVMSVAPGQCTQIRVSDLCMIVWSCRSRWMSMIASVMVVGYLVLPNTLLVFDEYEVTINTTAPLLPTPLRVFLPPARWKQIAYMSRAHVRSMSLARVRLPFYFTRIFKGRQG